MIDIYDKSAFKKIYEGTVRYMLRHTSELGRRTLERPGSWDSIEWIYENNPNGSIRNALDYLLLNLQGGRALRNRLNSVKSTLYDQARDYSLLNGGVEIIDVGSGPGHYVMDVATRLGEESNVHVTCLDADKTALEHGKKLVRSSGNGVDIEFIEGSALRPDKGLGKKYDVALAIGLIEYFEDGLAKRVLENIDKVLKPNGTLITSNMKRHNLSWLMDIANWKLVYREPEHLESLLRDVGHDKIDIKSESENLFSIGVSKRSSY